MKNYKLQLSLKFVDERMTDDRSQLCKILPRGGATSHTQHINLEEKSRLSRAA